MIDISVNNEQKKIDPGVRVSDAIIAWGFADSKIAIAINNEFVPRSTYAEREIKAGDKIDIVKPVGGG